MKRGLILLILLLAGMLNVNAYELIIPTDKKVATTSDYALFVGRSKGYETITINKEGVFRASNGAFAHSVKLHDGENRIIIRSTYGSIQVFKFFKTPLKNIEIPVENFEPQLAFVVCDNAPLRSTPVDAGLNRMSHLFQGTRLIINGSKGDFYRVILSKDKVGWIEKKQVRIEESSCSEVPQFLSMESKRFKNAMTQSISFTDKLPYTIEDCDKEIIFRVYNPEYSEESVYNLNIPKPEKYVHIVTLNDGTYNFKVKKVTENIKDVVVAVDAGHGGSEKGAIGCLGDEEKDINLSIAAELGKILESKGIKVVQTREYDANLSLDDRVRIARENGADIFVSIHLNSIGNAPFDLHKTRGTSVYYYNNNSEKLAQSVLKHVTRSANTHDDGVKTASFAVIRPADYVGILVETAYMINPLDSVLYRDNKFPHKAAKGIADGIIEFLKK